MNRNISVVFSSLLIFVFFFGCDVSKPKPENGTAVAVRSSAESDVVKDAKSSIELPQTYDDPEFSFSFGYPKEWNLAPFTMGSRVLVAGTPENGFAPNINVIVQPRDEKMFSTKKEDFKKLYETVFRDLVIKDFTVRKFADAKAICIIYTGTLGENNRVEGRQYIFDHKEKNLVVTLSDSPDRFKIHEPIFESILASFQLK